MTVLFGPIYSQHLRAPQKFTATSTWIAPRIVPPASGLQPPRLVYANSRCRSVIMSASDTLNASAGTTAHSSRLAALSGYDAIPVVNDALSFQLPSSSNLITRKVDMGEKGRWELWSPNSTRKAYYPGISTVPQLKLHSRPPKSLRRTDGHLGRFDPTVNTQHWSRDYPWYPLIRREGDKKLHPEFTPIAEACDVNLGYVRVKESFILSLQQRLKILHAQVEDTAQHQVLLQMWWDSRPQRPVIDELETLAGTSDIELIIDLYAAIQRGLKSMSAWIKFAHLKAQTPLPKELNDSWDMKFSTIMPKAQETLLGCWINGADRDEVLWLMMCKIPCYVVHQFDSCIDYTYGSHLPRHRSHIQGTDVEMRRESPMIPSHPDEWARSLGLLVVHESDDAWIAQHEEPSCWADRCRSSSWGQGWLYGRRGDPLIVRSQFTELGGIIHPPPVAKASPGKWTHWQEQIGEDGHVWLIGGTRTEPKEFECRYYDRENCRVLYFDDEATQPRHYRHDPEIFGWPVPEMPFAAKMQQGRDMHQIPASPSAWMYSSRDPPRKDSKHKSRALDSTTLHPPSQMVDLDHGYDSQSKPSVVDCAKLTQGSEFHSQQEFDAQNQRNLKRRLSESQLLALSPRAQRQKIQGQFSGGR